MLDKAGKVGKRRGILVNDHSKKFYKAVTRVNVVKHFYSSLMMGPK
jgi:hypothetical protein